MAFEGGPLSVVGITPSYITGLATQTGSSGVAQAIGQVWQGSGQSFFGSAGQALGGALAGSAINIALNSALGTNVVGPQGLQLNSGTNILASTITPYVTSTVAAGINQNIQQSLKSAGPFGPILSNVGTSLVNQASNGLSDAIFGATSTATNYKMFPGGGGEPSADYGGSTYTLTDVVFSIQPANQGPQAFGDSQSYSLPKSVTTLPFNELSSMPLQAGSPTANVLKQNAMVGGLSKAKVSSSNFTTGSLF
jgi:hypothetical protein